MRSRVHVNSRDVIRASMRDQLSGMQDRALIAGDDHPVWSELSRVEEQQIGQLELQIGTIDLEGIETGHYAFEALRRLMSVE